MRHIISNSFPRSAWERFFGRSASPRFPHLLRMDGDAERPKRRSHAEHGNEI